MSTGKKHLTAALIGISACTMYLNACAEGCMTDVDTFAESMRNSFSAGEIKKIPSGVKIACAEQKTKSIIIFEPSIVDWGNPDAIYFKWDANTAPGIREADRIKFESPTECKILEGGRKMLVTASMGGVAIVEIPSGKTLLYKSVTAPSETWRDANPHSAEMLPDGNIAVEAKPHIGTDVLSHVVADMRNALQSMGVEIRFNSCMTDFDTRDGRIVSVTVNGKEKLPCCAAVLAIGQAARDTYRLLVSKGIELVPKPFAVGVRIEHPQDFINRSQFGRFAGHPRLGAAEYRLTGKSGSRGVYTFCMCPGGVVVASSSAENQVVTNGMSYHSRSERNANSAVIVQVNPSDFASADPLSGIIFQEKLENAAFRLGGGDYSAPAMRVGDFLNRKKPEHFGSVAPTYRPNAVPRDIRKCMPPAISNGIEDGIRTFARQIHNFDMYDAVLTAIESRSSSPVRIARDENGEATRLKGLYPVGEGAGYAGGIVSAAVDGMRAAERIISRFKPMRG